MSSVPGTLCFLKDWENSLWGNTEEEDADTCCEKWNLTGIKVTLCD